MVNPRLSMVLDEPERGRVLDALEGELFERGELEPLCLGGADERAWMDCELASYAENRIGDPTSPEVLTDAHRQRWLAQATTGPLWKARARVKYHRLYWQRSGGQREGTLALAVGAGHGRAIRASSLYVLPQHRGRGTVSAMMRWLRERLGEHGLVLSLVTGWTWQRAVRMYLRLGAWVEAWKDDVSLCFDAALPELELEIEGDRATMAARVDGERLELHRAWRAEDRLVEEEPRPSEHPAAEELRWLSSSTFAMELALRGWPLVRSVECWERECSADFGPPEALGYRIVHWEAWSRHQGWRVDAPRIPGLRYPSWEELEAIWERQRAEYERRHAAGDADGGGSLAEQVG